jgi:hypothetical protein
MDATAPSIEYQPVRIKKLRRNRLERKKKGASPVLSQQEPRMMKK